MTRIVNIGKVYKHFKGNIYLVEDIACDCETLEKVVIYRALYNDCKLWVRPYNDFISEVDKVKYPDVVQKYRFEEIILDDNLKK